MRLLRKLSQLSGNMTTHGGVIVLTYHHVDNELPKGELVVRTFEFEKQMFFLNFFRNAFKVISLDEALLWLREGIHAVERRTKVLITFDDGYGDNYRHAFPVLKRYSFPAVVFLTTGPVGAGRGGYLKQEEIAEMARSGISFGAHTHTHPHMTAIAPEELKGEIRRSLEALESITGRRGAPFCYPYGDFDHDVKIAVREAGFSCAFSVKPGINIPGQDIFEIKRIDVLGSDNFSSFKYKLTDKYGR